MRFKQHNANYYQFQKDGYRFKGMSKYKDINNDNNNINLDRNDNTVDQIK